MTVLPDPSAIPVSPEAINSAVPPRPNANPASWRGRSDSPSMKWAMAAVITGTSVMTKPSKPADM